jgi:glycosyltransferase involved in cell wall biosynthesis
MGTVPASVRFLFWHGGRFGGAPRFAVHLAEGLAELPETEVLLSLGQGAVILRDSPGGSAGGSPAIHCDMVVETYAGLAGFLSRLATAPFAIAALARRVAALRPDIAICAQPGPLDLLMAAALRRLRVRFVVVVHDADAHPGDGFPLQMWLQRLLCRRANAVAALTGHVGDRLLRQKLAGTPARPLIRLTHPPIRYSFAPRQSETGTFRLLSFGRLLPYKGLDLLAESLTRLGSRPGLSVRVVGSGPESRELAALRALPGVTVENRWVPETEVGALFSWADAVVLPYREASQSGVAAVALAAHRYVIATNVGGLAEQLRDEPMAILCEPDAASLTSGLRRALDEPPRETPVTGPDAATAWRDMARSLLDQIDSMGISGADGSFLKRHGRA